MAGFLQFTPTALVLFFVRSTRHARYPRRSSSQAGCSRDRSDSEPQNKASGFFRFVLGCRFFFVGLWSDIPRNCRGGSPSRPETRICALCHGNGPSWAPHVCELLSNVAHATVRLQLCASYCLLALAFMAGFSKMHIAFGTVGVGHYINILSSDWEPHDGELGPLLIARPLLKTSGLLLKNLRVQPGSTLFFYCPQTSCVFFRPSIISFPAQEVGQQLAGRLLWTEPQPVAATFSRWVSCISTV